MLTFTSLAAIGPDAFPSGTAIAIGKFDGVHRGHQALIRRIAEVSTERSLDPVVFTFASNPLSLLRPDLCPPPIMSVNQRIEALEGAGASVAVVVPFDEELASMSAESFVTDVLVGVLHARHLCVGKDFRFGHGGVGTPETLVALGETLGFSVEIIESIMDTSAGKVSSSLVRSAMGSGDVRRAGEMLGRLPAVRGEVVRGDARGRGLGFPTANLGGLVEGLIPGDGVYAGWAIVRGERLRAAISVGANVTFEPEGEPRVEAFILDYQGDLYGERITIEFVDRIRGMIAFSDIDSLVARMKDDVARSREILDANTKADR